LVFPGHATLLRLQPRPTMSLISFHRLLIATAILFCGGFAVWELLRFREEPEVATLLIALAFAVAAGTLGYYLRHLSRILRLRDDSR